LSFVLFICPVYFRFRQRKKEVQEHWMIASCKLPQNDDWKPKHHQESMLASEREKEKRDDGIAELHGAMTQV